VDRWHLGTAENLKGVNENANFVSTGQVKEVVCAKAVDMAISTARCLVKTVCLITLEKDGACDGNHRKQP